ncbi:MAG: hypothetical protein Kow0098_21240 [Ignavibacteriaceae bacterium]
MIRLILTLTLFILIHSCTDENYLQKPDKINLGVLRSLVAKSLEKDINANRVLSVLFDEDNFPGLLVNRISVDSLSVDKNIYYIILLEFPDPRYNRFAVYNSELDLLLLDKSLNGALKFSLVDFNGVNYFKINEAFVSKDQIALNRTTLYRPDGNRIRLVFRNFTQYAQGLNSASQHLIRFTTDTIITAINGIPGIKSELRDTFYFNSSTGEFVSNENLFNRFVFSEVGKLQKKLKNPHLGLQDSGTGTKKNPANSLQNQYSLSLDSDWEKIEGIKINEPLTKEMRADRFVNEKIGAEITIVKIPATSKAEDFIAYQLDKSTSGEYLVRYTEKIEKGKNYQLFFEHSCNQKKYLFILTVSKYTFPKYEEYYHNISNSFFIECL